MRKIKKSIFLFLAITPLLFLVFCTRQAFGYSDQTKNKAIAAGIYNCYTAKGKDGSYVFPDSVRIDDVKSIDDIITNQDGGTVYLYKEAINKTYFGTVSCYELFNGYWTKNVGKFNAAIITGGLSNIFTGGASNSDYHNGLIEQKGIAPGWAGERSSVIGVVELFGYQESANGNLQTTLTFEGTMQYSDGTQVKNETREITFSSDDNWGQKSPTIIQNVFANSSRPNFLTLEYSNGKIIVEMSGAILDPKYGFDNRTYFNEYKISDFGSFDDLLNTIKRDLRLSLVCGQNNKQCAGGAGGGGYGAISNGDDSYNIYVLLPNYTDDNGKFHNEEYVEQTINLNDFTVNRKKDTYVIASSHNNPLPQRRQSAMRAINNFLGTGYKAREDFKFEPEETVALYQFYIDNYYKPSKSCGLTDLQIKSYEGSEDSVIIDSVVDGVQTKCLITPTQGIWAPNNVRKILPVNGVDEDGYFGKWVYFKDIVKGADISNYPDFDIDKYNEIAEDDGQENGSADSACWDSGLDSQAWVLCPTEANLSALVKGADKLIDNMLVIDKEWYDDDSGTHKAWNVMAGIANIAMSIILLVVIFSQVTGYGIDNYGIKKILPKLIMMAILINLSFILCEIMLDLSNIVGNGLREMFYGIGARIAGPDNPYMNNVWDWAIPTLYSAFGAAGFISSIVTVVATGSGTAMAVIFIIFILLTVLLAILLFFLMLGARVIIIIACVTLAPLAFACYVLPNTQKITKRWWDILKAALVIYPICGAVSGISYMIKAIVVGSGAGDKNVLAYIIAVMGPYLPFFMLPTMLKGVISALGTVGAALSSMGGALKSGFNKATNTAGDIMKQSAGYQNAMRERERNRQWANANRTINSNKRKTEKGRTLSAAEMRRGERAQEMLNKLNAEDTGALQASFDEQYANADIGDLERLLENEVARFNPNARDATERRNRINALSNLMVQRGGASGASAISRVIRRGVPAVGAGGQAVVDASGNRVYDGLNAAQLKIFRDNFSTNRDLGNLMRSKDGATYDMASDLGRMGDFSSYAAKAVMDGSLSSVKDWIAQGEGETRSVMEAMSAIANKWATDPASVTEGEKKAITKFMKLRDGIISSTDPAIQSAIHGNPEKMKLWEDFNPMLPNQVAPLNPHPVVGGNNGAQDDQTLYVPRNIEGPDGANGVSE